MTGSLRAALGSLTILPMGTERPVADRVLARSFLWYPLVGLVIGAALAGAHAALERVLPAQATHAVVLALWVGLTGAWHVDGLGDVADALAGSRDRRRRLAIMRDPRIGAVGAASIALLVLLKWAALDAMDEALVGRVLMLAPCMGRSAMVLAGATLPYARPEGGLGTPFARHARRSWVLAVWGMAALAGWALAGRNGLVLWATAGAWAVAWRAWARRVFGGFTGDVLGAGGELTEAVVLLVAAGLRGS